MPGLMNMSELSLNLDASFDIAHPVDRRFYPTTPTRIRVMALGGPFQPWLDYRQELAGHLHYGMRCFICLELAGKYRQYKQIWDMTWCIDCYDLYMLSMPSPQQYSSATLTSRPSFQILIKSLTFLVSRRSSRIAHTIALSILT